MSETASQIEYFTAADGYRFAAHIWPTEQPRGRVVFVHGIVSHGGWYLSSCSHLAREGYEVHFLDRRGSGLNSHSRGDADRYDVWLDDVERYLESQTPRLPTVLLGISWGGKLVAAVARHKPHLLSGFCMICPGLFAKQQANSWQRRALRFARAAGLGSLRIPIPLQDPALFTDTPSWQTYIKDDPLTLRKVTIRFTVADLALNQYVAESPEDIHTPAMLILTKRDRIVDNQRTLDFFDRLGTTEKKLILYADAAHTLEFEGDPSQYFADLSRWTQKVIGGTRSSDGESSG